MQSTDKFCFRWGEFETNVEKSFREVRIAKDFTDVTLLCEDGEIDAHRLVLSSGSVFFEEVLKRTKNPQPLLYLKGFKKRELKFILDFLYEGEANVFMADIERFFEISKELKVKGISEKTEDQDDFDNIVKQVNETPEKVPTEDKYEIEDASVEFDNIVKQIDETSEKVPREDKYEIVDTAADVGDFKKLSLLKYFVKIGKIQYKCNICHDVVEQIALTKERPSRMARKHLIENHPDIVNDFEKNGTEIKDEIEDASVYVGDLKKQSLLDNFVKLGKIQYKCLICHDVLEPIALKKEKPSIMAKKHLVTNHPDIVSGFKEDINESSLNNVFSKAWETFDIISQTEAKCKLCGRIVPCLFGSTASLSRHVQKKCSTSPKYSEVWNFFDKISKSMASCKICGTDAATPGGTTTNTWRHIKNNHKEEYLGLKYPPSSY